MSYQIETRGTNGQWTRNIGDGRNEFATHADAEAAIECLRALGDDWASADYRIIIGAEGEVAC